MVTARSVVARVPDPELPFLTIEDLGILRSVDQAGTTVRVTITPTYSGCPATEAIRDDIVTALGEAGYADVAVETVLSPAWTTDWMSDAGRRALKDHGIAPPGHGPVFLPFPAIMEKGSGAHAWHRDPFSMIGAEGGGPSCPRCGATDTEELSRFGATACKSLWRCRECREPFELFKAH